MRGLLGIVLLTTSAGSWAADPPRVTRAVLVGVDAYEKLPPLGHGAADVELLARALVGRGGVDPDHVLRLTSGADTLPPTLENWTGRVPGFLRKARAGETVLVSFSGYGFRDAAGKAHLLPQDADRQHAGRTAVSLALLRKHLEDCPASVKVLILNLAPAATGALKVKDLEAELKGAAGVYTLLACQDGEQSLAQEDRKAALFTHWLARGLEGAADDNGDGVVDAEELHAFVRDRVRAAARRLGKVQTPTRIAGPRLPEALPLVTLGRERIGETLARVAELLHELLLEQGAQKVALAEPAARVGREEHLGRLGAFGLVAAEELERRLASGRARPYAVADQRQVSAALKDFRVDDLTSPASLKKLPERIPRLDVLVTGSFQRLTRPDRLHLRCRLLKLPDGDVLGSLSAVLRLDEELWALLGGSADVQVEPAPRPGAAGPVELLEAEARKPHPLLKQDFPFRLTLRSAEGDRVKEPAEDPKDPNRLLVAARPDEEFAIEVENRSAERVMMRLLVDGINTIVQRDEDRDLSRVLLEEARGWVLQPGKKYVIRGWHFGAGKGKAEARRFKFVAPVRSVAGRLGFGEGVGLITAAFYAEAKDRSTARSVTPTLNVGEGERVTVEVKQSEFLVGRQLAVVSLRYVHEDALKK